MGLIKSYIRWLLLGNNGSFYGFLIKVPPSTTPGLGESGEKSQLGTKKDKKNLQDGQCCTGRFGG